MKSENKNRKTLERKAASSLPVHGVPVGEFYEHWSLAEIAAGRARSEEAGDYKAVLRWCADMLETSPAGRQLLAEAKAMGWRAGLADLPARDFYLDVPQKLLLLDNHGLEPRALAGSEYFRHAVLINIIRALRDIWQEKRHGGFDEDYGPEGVLMLERVRAADCDVIAALVAWELRCAGEPGIWRHLIGSTEGDIALSFSQHLERAPAASSYHGALETAFRQWYRDEARINACDHETLEYLDDVLRGAGETNPFGPARLTAVAVELLSCLPDKTAYLKGHGREIIGDPAYYGLGDPINQSHLFHIMYDLQAVRVGGVAFRDEKLAGRIFPKAPLGSGRTGKTSVP